MAAKVIWRSVGEDIVDLSSRQSEPVGEIVHGGHAGTFPVGVHLHRDRHGLSIRGVHLDAKQHAMAFLGLSPVRRLTAAQSRLLESRGVANAQTVILDVGAASEAGALPGLVAWPARGERTVLPAR